LKVIDWKNGGFALRLYLGREDLKDWHGDDWDDAPWQDNAGQVYEEFVEYYIDIILPEEAKVWEPGGCYEVYLSKEQIIKRELPVIIDLLGTCWSYDNALQNKNTIKIYIGKPLSGVSEG